MNLRDSYFSDDAEHDITLFAANETRKRVLVFPPVNNYRRFLIHQLVQDRFAKVLHTFSIGQGLARRTVVCYKSDVLRDPKLDGAWPPASNVVEPADAMGIEGRSSPSTTPEHNTRQRQVKTVPTVEIYRPPAARRASKGETSIADQPEQVLLDNSAKLNRQKRPDRAVYVPRHRRGSPQPCASTRDRVSASSTVSPKYSPVAASESPSTSYARECARKDREVCSDHNFECKNKRKGSDDSEDSLGKSDDAEEANQIITKQFKLDNSLEAETNADLEPLNSSVEVKTMNERNRDVESSSCEVQPAETSRARRSVVTDVLIISGKDDKVEKREKKEVPGAPLITPEKKVKKVERQKSKPVPPPSPPLKINRDECDWDSLFDDNGDCLDPTLIDELTSAVGEVMIEQPKNTYKAYTKPIEVSTDEFAHVLEVYNFPSEYKTSDLAAVFSPFKNGGFELKWVDDTHCLGVFSSPLIAAEVLASDHPFVKTRPLSEATALSKTKARKSSEFLQPYKSRPETCAALARRLVTGALGVKLATARQEREREKIVLREAKEKRRLANKQRDDAWEGVIAQK